jgi:hypothetical protein
VIEIGDSRTKRPSRGASTAGRSRDNARPRFCSRGLQDQASVVEHGNPCSTALRV